MRSMSPTLHRIINILCKHTLVKKIKGRPNIASWQNSAIFRGLHWKKGFVKRGNINFNLADIYNCNYVYVAEFSGGWVQPHLLVLLQPNSYREVPEFFFSNLLEDSGNMERYLRLCRRSIRTAKLFNHIYNNQNLTSVFPTFFFKFSYQP